jgi:hypothetical protein
MDRGNIWQHDKSPKYDSHFGYKLISISDVPILSGVEIIGMVTFLHCESRIRLLVDCMYCLLHVLMMIHYHFSLLYGHIFMLVWTQSAMVKIPCCFLHRSLCYICINYVTVILTNTSFNVWSIHERSEKYKGLQVFNLKLIQFFACDIIARQSNFLSKMTSN